jgi:hypothetical protein
MTLKLLRLRYDAHQKHELHNKKSILLDILAIGDDDVFSLLTIAVEPGRLVSSCEGGIISAKDIKH